LAGGFRLLPVPHSAPLSLARRLAARRFRPRTTERRGPLTNISLSRLNHTAFALAVYASQLSSSRRNCTATQDSLPTVGQTLPGGIGYPQGYFVRFRSLGLHDFLLTQASPGAIRFGIIPIWHVPLPDSFQTRAHRLDDSASRARSSRGRTAPGSKRICGPERTEHGLPVSETIDGARVSVMLRAMSFGMSVAIAAAAARSARARARLGG